MAAIKVLSSKEFFSASISILDADGVARIWGVKPRHAYRYAAVPANCGDNCKDPVQKLLENLRALKEKGRSDIVEGGLKLLADPVGYNVKPKDACTDKDSALHELLDLHRELGKLSECIQDCLADGELSDVEKVKVVRQADEAIKQLEQLKDAISKGLK